MITAPARWQRRLIAVCLLVVLALDGCDLLPPNTIEQGHGFPTLRRLDWGFSAIYHPIWSLDGRWIAVLAGDDYADAHMEVVSPDGKTRYDLSSWGCGEGPDPDYAWLPDGRLSCINADAPYPKMCIGAPPFSSCTATRINMAVSGSQRGLAWSPDGRSALFSAWPNDGSGSDYSLYVLSTNGLVRQVLSFPGYYGAMAPSFRPRVAELAYYRGVYVDTGGIHANLVIGSISEDVTGKYTLGTARVLATKQDTGLSFYAWSPSGRWLAVRIDDYQGGDQSRDKISVVNPDNPQQTIDVVQVDLIDRAMMDPIWSPDGKTLIVFSVGFSVSQPYAIDIASYLASKGLQV